MAPVKQRSQKTYARKRRFYGNRFTISKKEDSAVSRSAAETSLEDHAPSSSSCIVEELPTDDVDLEEIPIENQPTSSVSEEPPKSGTSADKVESINDSSGKPLSGFRFIEISILSSVLMSLAFPECFSIGMILHENFTKKKGLSSHLSAVCKSCSYSRNFYTSPVCGKYEGFEINRRIVYALRSCGVGYNGLEKLLVFLNMSKPMLYNNLKIVKLFSSAAKKIATLSLRSAAARLTSSESVSDIGVSVDSTWQRRGYSSLNGVVAAISIDNGKILDIEVMNKHCNGCALIESKKSAGSHCLRKFKSRSRMFN